MTTFVSIIIKTTCDTVSVLKMESKSTRQQRLEREKFRRKKVTLKMLATTSFFANMVSNKIAKAAAIVTEMEVYRKMYLISLKLG